MRREKKLVSDKFVSPTKLRLRRFDSCKRKGKYFLSIAAVVFPRQTETCWFRHDTNRFKYNVYNSELNVGNQLSTDSFLNATTLIYRLLQLYASRKKTRL